MNKNRPYDKQISEQRLTAADKAALSPFNKTKNMQIIYPNTVYKHFKEKYYYVLGFADNATNGSESKIMVVYKQLYGDNKLYIREYEEFASEVDRKKYPDVEQKYRFARVELDELLELFNLRLVTKGDNWVEYTDGTKILCIDREYVYYDIYRPMPVSKDIILLADIVRQELFDCKAEPVTLNTLDKR